MNKQTQINVDRIRNALTILKPNNELYEIRILKGKIIISGYFTDVDVLLNEFSKIDLRDANVFYTLNDINPGCYSRKQRDIFLQEKITTSDQDITGYKWLLIDLDPKRPTGVSSTNAELIKAHDKAMAIVNYLRDIGFSAPVMAMSGNGIHLLYPIKLLNKPENVELVSNCLKALDFLFSDETVAIDTTVSNPARISKLYGTMAQKGSSTNDRPHRMSRIISQPNTLEPVSLDILQRLADEYPHEVATPQYRNSSGSFDLDSWLDEHGIRVHVVKQWKDATRYVLEECPFDSSHKAPDATIIKMGNGAICFKCLHNSCAGHTWHEFRLKYEPDAYDDKRAEQDARIEEGWKRYMQYNRQRDDITYQPKPPEEKPEAMFETIKMIMAKPKEERVCIPTGLIDLDRRIVGFAKGEITLVSGLRASAKSTLLSQICLDAIDRGFNALFYSGELKDKRFARWIVQQAAGADRVVQSKKYPNMYFPDADAEKGIVDWLGEHFYLYDNAYGNNFLNIAANLRDAISAYQSDLVVIDNMSILDLSNITEDRLSDKWDRQRLFVELLKNLAIQCNCHILFVAHPRKAMGFLRLDDVGGSGSLSNLVDNAIIVHRINTDFKKGFKMYTGKEWTFGLEGDRRADSTNCIEVVKERESGLQDFFIPLWYEMKTRRLRNSKEERKVYGWDSDGFIGEQMDMDDLPFKDETESKP